MSIGADRKERLACLTAVTLLHLVLAPALLMSLAPTFVRNVKDTLGVFNVRPVPPPPPIEIEPPPPPPVKKRIEALPEPAPQDQPPPPAAPPPIAAPQRIVDSEVPPPVAAGLVPGSGGAVGSLQGDPQGRLLGSGSGAGSTGPGGGGKGGTGAAKPVRRAELRSGKIVDVDYPSGARGEQGVVEAALAVDATGNVTGCEITRSSGNRVLDDTTCRLIRQRFKFTPARDAQGNSVPSERGWRQRWWRD